MKISEFISCASNSRTNSNARLPACLPARLPCPAMASRPLLRLLLRLFVVAAAVHATAAGQDDDGSCPPDLETGWRSALVRQMEEAGRQPDKSKSKSQSCTARLGLGFTRKLFPNL